MKRLVLTFLIALALSGCASLPLKERAVMTLDSSQQLLSQVQDTERHICNAVAFKTAPTMPIKECTGPLAAAAQLTTARHQSIAAALSRAFDAQIKASVVLRA